MTREEAITVLKGLSENPLFSNQHKAAFNIAIHDINQRHDWDINKLILINKDNNEPIEQEPKTGHWITLEDEWGDIGVAVCSCCDANGNHKWHYCPNCGAEMSEVEE